MTVVFHIDGFLFLRLDLQLVKALTPPPPSPLNQRDWSTKGVSGGL